MNRSDWLTDDLIEEAFERRAGYAAPVELRENIVTLTAVTGQRASWRLRLASAWSAPVLRPAWFALLVLGILLGAALALMLVGGLDAPDLLRQHADVRPQTDAETDGTRQESPRNDGPEGARAGLLAYTQDGDLYMANPDGSGATMVVHDPGVAFSAPTWSPDGRWLTLRGGEGLFLVDAGTLSIRYIADGGGAVWSTDSESLAFVPTSMYGADVIAIVEVGTGEVRELHAKLQPGQSVALPLAWSPDARWFLAPANAGDGKRFVRIDAATGEAVDIAPMYHLAEPGAHWSPDSRRFAYARPDDCGGNPPCQSSIVVEDADLTHPIAITDPAKFSTGPVWSPDGAWIAFSSATLDPSRGNPGPQVSAPTLSIVRPDGRDLHALAEVASYGTTFTWNADASAVDFWELDQSTGSGLGVSEVRISDGAKRPVVRAPGLDGYDWQANAAGLTVPSLPSVPAPATSVPASAVAPSAPRDAPPADPTGSWTGLAIDSMCDAGWIDFRTLTQRFVGPRCQESNGLVVAAPLGAAFAVPEPDGGVTVVQNDGSATKALAGVRPVQPGTFREIDLGWSPDGRWLSVPECMEGQPADCPEFRVISPDGRSQHSLPGRPSWSPDGQRLVVQAENGDLLIGSPDGSNLSSIGTFPVPSSWSPDASRFAFIRDGDAWVANADGTGQRNVTGFASGGAYDAVWSPDGRFVAVIQETQLWILAVDGGELRPIDLGPGRPTFYSALAWSPDGARLAIAVGPAQTPSMLIIRADDWTATALTGAGIDDVAWSPDGRFIALLDQTSKPGRIDIANSDGSGRHRIWKASENSGRITWVP